MLNDIVPPGGLINAAVASTLLMRVLTVTQHLISSSEGDNEVTRKLFVALKPSNDRSVICGGMGECLKR